MAEWLWRVAQEITSSDSKNCLGFLIGKPAGVRIPLCSMFLASTTFLLLLGVILSYFVAVLELWSSRNSSFFLGGFLWLRWVG
jgi:hypothetical protein